MPSVYTPLLIPDEPLQILPDLAVAIGLNEAIVLQQVHYWLNPKRNCGKDHDGCRWIYNSYDQWQRDNFPFWSTRTLRRIFTTLEEQGVLVARDDLNDQPRDRTKWYTINYTHESLSGGQLPKVVNASGQSGHPQAANLATSSITETTAETTLPVDNFVNNPPVPEIPTPPTPINRVGDDSPRDQLIREHCRAVGVLRPVDLGRARNNADRLIAAGITADDIPAMIAWFRQQDWIHDVDLSTLVRFADRWTSSGARVVSRDETQEELLANHPRFPDWVHLGLYEDGTAGCNQWMNDIRNGTLPQFRKVST